MIKKRFFDVTFYKTFPFMDYYKNEEAFAKDLRMIKDMYPLDTAMIQSAVEQRMDELEYEGSFIYDEVPDRQRLFDEADRIAGRFISEQSSRCFICTIAGILFNCELCRRRCRYRRYQRFW